MVEHSDPYPSGCGGQGRAAAGQAKRGGGAGGSCGTGGGCEGLV